jgi:hypothetical protein
MFLMKCSRYVGKVGKQESRWRDSGYRESMTPLQGLPSSLKRPPFPRSCGITSVSVGRRGGHGAAVLGFTACSCHRVGKRLAAFDFLPLDAAGSCLRTVHGVQDRTGQEYCSDCAARVLLLYAGETIEPVHGRWP